MMRTLAIGDIHGCLAPLTNLIKAIDLQPEDHLIFVGDYVDRGPDTKGVIDFLIDLENQCQLTCLSGNHEEKFFLARHGGSELADWLAHWGGKETLESYGGSMDDVPSSHWEFLRRTSSYLETDSHIFVHANLEADIALDQQIPYTLIHKKFGTPLPHQSGKVMICGHTVQSAFVPTNLGHAVCIDTDPGRGGWLTCLNVESGGYWQTNMAGEVREGTI